MNPTIGNVYILKSIIDDWDDKRSLTILKNCQRALPAGGKILIVEEVASSGDEFSPGNIVDVAMILILKGRERCLS